MIEALERISETDWSQLEDAYGNAANTPEQLAGLASEDPARRHSAQQALSCGIVHQGTVYSAAIPAIDILADLACTTCFPERDWILRFLARAGVGDTESFFRGGYDIRQEDPRNFEHPEAALAKRAYDEVERRLPQLRELLTDADPAVRRDAAFLLAMFMQHHEEHATALRQVLPSESDEQARTSMLVTLAIANYRGGHQRDLELLRGSLSDERLSGMGAVALAYLELPKELRGDVTAALRGVLESDPVDWPGFSWREGRLRTMAFDAMLNQAGKIPAEFRETLYACMARAEPEFGQTSERNELARRAAALEWRVAFSGFPRGEGVTPEQLSPAQRRLLEAISGSYSLAEPALCRASSELGLPSTLPALRRFLGTPSPAPLQTPLQLEEGVMTADDAFSRVERTEPSENLGTAVGGATSAVFTPAPKRCEAFGVRQLLGPAASLASALSKLEPSQAVAIVHQALVDEPERLPTCVDLLRHLAKAAPAEVAHAVRVCAKPYLRGGPLLTPGGPKGWNVRDDLLAWCLEGARLAHGAHDPAFDELLPRVQRHYPVAADAYLKAQAAAAAPSG